MTPVRYALDDDRLVLACQLPPQSGTDQWYVSSKFVVVRGLRDAYWRREGWADNSPDFFDTAEQANEAWKAAGSPGAPDVTQIICDR